MPTVLDATPENLDDRVLAPRDELVVVELWEPGCTFCGVFDRELPGLLAQLEGERLRLVKIDVAAHPSLAERFAIHSVPTFILMRDGRGLARMSQYYGREHWLKVVREYLAPSP